MLQHQRLTQLSKIFPECDFPVVHVNDASKAVGVAASLINDYKNDNVFSNSIKKEYEEFRDKFLGRKQSKKFATILDARNNKFKNKITQSEIYKPNF